MRSLTASAFGMNAPAVVLALALWLVATSAAQRPDQAPGTIRSSVTIVPLDVRVLDSRGNPVTDLTRADFAVFEDGEPQTIAQFSAYGLRADVNMANAGPLRPGNAPEGIQPASKRVFLLVLGRGRHEDVTRSISALESFLSERLLPQDQVALLAWNRATQFTTDHALIRRTVARYRQRHQRIETGLREWFSGLRAAYGPREIPPVIQQQIDEVFAQAAALHPRDVRPGQIAGERGLRGAMGQNTGDLITEEVAARRDPAANMIPDPAAEARAAMIGMDFDAYVAQSVETLQDIGALYAGLEFLRFLDGEKHLVLFTAAGLRLPRGEDGTSLGRVAASARITINTIHTGGTVAAPTPTSALSKGGFQMFSVPTSAQVANQGFAVRELRSIAEMTGGRASAFTYGDVALDRIDRASRFQYLLGYTPANATVDGKFRKVEVKVTRPGVTVLHRQGYFASRQPPGLDRQHLKSASRITAAAEFDRPIEELKISIDTAELKAGPGGAQLVLQVRVPLSSVEIVREDGLRRVQLELAVFCADQRGQLVHEIWEAVTLKLPEDAWTRYAAGGAPLRLQIQAPAGTRLVKMVVYDPGSDRIGSAVAKGP